MAVIRLLKRQLHRDICSDPVLHGLVLNFYLNGEEYPERVTEYFPGDVSWNPEIEHLLELHLADEKKHVALYSKALQKLSQPRYELPIPEIYNSVILSMQKPPLPSKSGDHRRLLLADFFAHLHFLEARIARSLEFHLDGCERSPSRYPSQAVKVVLEDEIRHARYTRDVVSELLPRGEASRVMSRNCDAESRANLLFSSRQLGMLTREYAGRFPAARRRIYRISAELMEWIANVR